MANYSLSKKEIETIRAIRNSIIHRNRPPSIRELMVSLDYRSPRSASLIIGKLIEKGFLSRMGNGSLQILRSFEGDEMHSQTLDIPLVGNVACGAPIFAEENIEAMIPISEKLVRPPHKYFLLRAQGDSMNEKGINNGDLVLVRQQQAAENGDIIIGLIDGEATVKEIQLTRDVVILKPRSTNKNHRPIIVSSDLQVQGVVVASIPAEHIEY